MSFVSHLVPSDRILPAAFLAAWACSLAGCGAGNAGPAAATSAPSATATAPDGSAATGSAPDRASMRAAGVPAGGGVAYWTCSMHPSVHLDARGKCPLCGMDLIPVSAAQAASGEVVIAEQRRQVIGVRTAAVAKADLRLTVRAAGWVTFDESAITDLNLRVAGRVVRLDANALGMDIHAGDPLFALDSPDLRVAEQEFLLALHDAAKPTAGTATIAAGRLAGARDRLRRLDVSAARIDAITRTNAVPDLEDIPAPATGVLIAKDVVQGDAVVPDQRLFRIAPLDHVWVQVAIFASDLPLVTQGTAVAVTEDTLPGRSFAGTIGYLYPDLDPDTHAARARVVLDNPDHLLHPGMFATATIAVDAGERLLVPKSAVIWTGPRRIVFVDAGAGRLRPRDITIGMAGDDDFEVLSGLAPGEVVVTSGNFLIAAESRISAAEGFWGDSHDGR